MSLMKNHVFDRTAFEAWASPRRDAVEKNAKARLTPYDANQATLVEAMAYAVTGGGKRIRALLVYAAGELTGAHDSVLTDVATAVEFVHAYSLVHDDLPCMDNDTLRRGKPTCHVKFGEAEAMLAGDALQPEAFSLLTKVNVSERARLAIIDRFALSCGREGMCAGQAIDLEHVAKPMSLELLRQMHRLKTGALIKACVDMGALCGDMKRYGAVQGLLADFSGAIGLGFQVVDDILDVTSDTQTLGKSAGKDALCHKPTYVSLLGLDASRKLAASTLDEALAALNEIEKTGLFETLTVLHLADLAHTMIGRTK